ncbi:MAG TPA: D-alanine--D-alanine ligase [Bacteroidia bacterium]|jgi:UDP-N-acetylmuramate--alanine ligase|nr:D-alanine--D-alanine ligase [Bacteroidia bacterium]
MSKIKVGIVFGGFSKEREVSFAGGRTVYDNLNKSIFEAIPLFVDSFGNFVLLNWQFIYKGSIRDFYPPVEFLPADNTQFQLYAENLGDLSAAEQDKLIEKIGKKIPADQLHGLIDIAFLCLHGPYGEDGKIQGLFEYHKIPYTGSGILSSSIGIDKSIQKQLMVNAGFNSPDFFTIDRTDYVNGKYTQAFTRAREKNVPTGRQVKFPLVVKPANQGSSIGVTILTKEDEHAFTEAVEKAFFTKRVEAKEWNRLNAEQKFGLVRTLSDIREGIGMPCRIGHEIIYDPNKLIGLFNTELKNKETLVVESLDGESTVLVEGFIEGREFSCIVLEDEDGKAIALPPTEIKKGKELFDYRSKYLPGLSRKITPIDLPTEQINKIRTDCEKLFYALHFDVYARIDGFITREGKVFLNDPNTTSGMMPSSFFFHQAAEIGLNPSQFLTYIIHASLTKRIKQSKGARLYEPVMERLEQLIKLEKTAVKNKIRVAVILGGYSSERHISVESGRNVYEKLSSSEKYRPVPVFLSGNNEKHLLYQVPINILLKDNADDIKEKIENYSVHPVVKGIISLCSPITEKYSTPDTLAKPALLSYDELAKKVDAVFIALHGRPGEDGHVQEKLEQYGLPYNGSGKASSEITINKYITNQILKENGMLVAEHILVTEEDWNKNKSEIEKTLSGLIKYPFIAKPVDDGCSSAVKKIKTFAEFEAFAKLIFRNTEELDAQASHMLHIKDKEEFPRKNVILVEELISKKDAQHFLEITGGMITHYKPDGKIEYEVFEASEALSSGEVLSLEEKFLAGQGQNITPARYARDTGDRQKISDKVKEELKKAARVLNVTGYCRIDAFVRVYENCRTEVIFIEVNSLPGMTPATCIFHQAAINNYKPYEFIDSILEFGVERNKTKAIA